MICVKQIFILRMSFETKNLIGNIEHIVKIILI